MKSEGEQVAEDPGRMLQIMRKVKETELARTVVNVWKTNPLGVTPLVAASKRLDVEEVQKLLTIEQHTRVEEMNRALRKVVYAEDDDEDPIQGRPSL